MSAFSQKEAGVGVETKEDAGPAPSTPVAKEGGSSTDQAKGDCMAVDDVKQQPAAKEDSGATPTSDTKAGGKSSSGKKRGAGAFSAKGSDSKSKGPEAGMRTMDMFLKPSSSIKKAKTEGSSPPAKENMPPPTRLEMPSGPAKEDVMEDASSLPAAASASAETKEAPSSESDIMVIDDDDAPSAPAGMRQKLVAQVRPAAPSAVDKPSAAPAADKPPAPAETPAGTACDGASAPKPMVSKPSGVVKKAKVAPLSSEENNKKLKVLNEELSALAKVAVHGDSIPFLRAADDEPEVLDGVEEGDEVLPARTRQVIARCVEGSSKTAGELAAWLQGRACVAKGIEVDGEVDLGCYERAIEAVAEYEEGYFVSEAKEGVARFQCVWMVKDVADIPQEFRALVDAHRKLGASIKERATLATKMVHDIEHGAGKELAKLDKTLLSVKDRQVKLEEKEKKEREKIKDKMEAEKKKAQEKFERMVQKEEAEKKKEEEAKVKKEKKEEETKAREEREAKRKAEREAQAVDQEADKDTKEVDKDFEAKAAKPVKKAKPAPAASAQQKNFMSNFFVKKPSTSVTSPAKPSDDAKDSTGPSPAKSAASSASSEGKPIANFRGWENPAHSTVAGFPWGPGRPVEPASEDLPEPTIQSWVSKWKKQPPRILPARPLRDDGVPHKKMKLIHLHMRLPVVNTQLLDVDIDSMKKVVWDVEENSEEQLQAILAAAVEDEDGIYHWEGKMLQFQKEGGGYFDPRRPPFFGTHSKVSGYFSEKNPLGQDPEIDYDYESDVDWESETGDGEDLMSDLGDEEEEEEEEEDGSGFVVADGEWDGGANGVTKKKLVKLHQVIYEGANMPEDVADLYSMRVLSDLPLMLSRDSNLVLDQGYDYEGGDLTSFKAPDLESVMIALHKHPTASAFTWVDPESDNKYAGVAFLKTADASATKIDGQEHLLSGHLRVIPHCKKDAIEREKQLAFAAQMLAAREAAQAAAEKAAAEKKAQRSTSALQKKPIEDMLSEAHLKELVAVLHGTPKGKPQVVDLLHKACELNKAAAGALVSRVSTKRSQRFVINDKFLEDKGLVEVAAEAWEVNFKEPVPAKKVAEKAGNEEAEREAECGMDKELEPAMVSAE